MMRQGKTSLLSVVLKGGTLASSILLLISCLYRTSRSYDIVFLDLLALVLPYLVITTLFFGLISALGMKKMVLLPLISLALWYLTLGPFLGFHGGKTVADSEDVSVLSYNVMELEGSYPSAYTETAPKIMEFVLKQDADIVCFQEFARTRLTRERLKAYPHEYHFGHTNGKKYSPMAIYSKYPILSSGSLDFPNSNNNAIYADLLIRQDTIRVYNVHLQSLRFRPGSIRRENPIRLMNRLGRTIRQQKAQVALVAEHIGTSPYPLILCGDLNNTQYSQVNGLLKKDLKDSFLEKGKGLGTTLIFKFMPFRIDYVLVDPILEITEHRNFDVAYSDHYPVRASFRLPPR